MALNLPSLQNLASSLPKEVQTALRSALSAQDQLNQDIALALKNIATWTWARPALQHGWLDFSTSLVARYTKLATGLVVISGSVKSGTIGTSAFVLPTAFCPDQEVDISPWSTGETDSKLVILPSGLVVPVTGSNTQFSLDCSFMAAGG